MIRSLGLAAVGLLLGAMAVAQVGPELPAFEESTPAVKSELIKIVTAQTEAFRAKDYVKAYTFAAQEIKALYPESKFEQMVLLGYPLIATSTATDFGPALDNGEDGVVYVRFGDAKGAHRMYRYTLKHEVSGWKITGVSETEDSPSAGAPLSA